MQDLDIHFQEIEFKSLHVLKSVSGQLVCQRNVRMTNYTCLFGTKRTQNISALETKNREAEPGGLLQV